MRRSVVRKKFMETDSSNTRLKTVKRRDQTPTQLDRGKRQSRGQVPSCGAKSSTTTPANDHTNQRPHQPTTTPANDHTRSIGFQRVLGYLE
ncbi:hypothetical protein Pmani_014532 [Petrolisthes manimaculis]|uniref:Uncharacterized protein n=1 Tax=Petrolisthes manimaculis TaxID=1843537 RepID=A0AAE1PSS4_9EUCA|nr:hypothetical protein Pmani_014532 [Petrolisthes manimaculis]